MRAFFEIVGIISIWIGGILLAIGLLCAIPVTVFALLAWGVWSLCVFAGFTVVEPTLFGCLAVGGILTLARSIFSRSS